MATETAKELERQQAKKAASQTNEPTAEEIAAQEAQAKVTADAEAAAAETAKAAEAAKVAEANKEDVKGKKPKSKLQEYLFKEDQNPVEKPVVTVEDTDEIKAIREKAAKYESLKQNPSYIATLKAIDENKSLLDVVDEMKLKNPSRLTNEEIYRLELKENDITDPDDVEDYVKTFLALDKLEQNKSVKQTRKELIEKYNADLKTFADTYTPQAKEATNFINGFQAELQQAKGQVIFGGALAFDESVIKRTEEFINSKPSPRIMRDVFALYANHELALTNAFNDGANSVTEEAIEQIKGNGGGRSIHQTVTPKKDESIAAKQKDLEKQIRSEKQPFDQKVMVLPQK